MKLYFAMELGSSTFSMPLDDDSAAGDPVSMFGFTSPIGVGVVGVVELELPTSCWDSST